MKAIFTTTGEVKISDDLQSIRNSIKIMVKVCDVPPETIIVEGCTRKQAGLPELVKIRTKGAAK